GPGGATCGRAGPGAREGISFGPGALPLGLHRPQVGRRRRFHVPGLIPRRRGPRPRRPPLRRRLHQPNCCVMDPVA
ncbi:hypothetical protein HMI54_009574, partial [Coelomomyces lativittatus]